MVEESEEVPRGDGLNAQLFRASKVFRIVGDNVTAASGQRQFENHVVIGIGQKGPPEEKDVLQQSLSGQKAQKTEHIQRALSGGPMLRTGQHILPFAVKPYRQTDLEP